MNDTYAPPASIKINEHGMLGLDFRKWIILGVSLTIGAATILVWQTSPIYIRGPIGVFVALMGIALAFGQLNGKTPELWLLDFLGFMRRERFMIHSSLRAPIDNRQVKFEQAPAATTRPAVKAHEGEAAWNFFVLTANAIALTLLSGLTLWLYQGGAHDLHIWWNNLFGIVRL